jgi:hypothetical protein
MLNLNENIRANIFRLPGGDYAVVVLALPKGMVLASPTVSLTIEVKVAGARGLKHAVILGVEHAGYSIEEPAHREDGSLQLTVPRHGAASMVLLTSDLDRLRSRWQWHTP